MMICEFKKEHLDDVYQLECDTFSQPWSREALEKAINTPYATFFVFELEGRAVGYIGMYTASGEGSITNVAVKDTFRGRGIGSALISALIKKGEELGLEYITLEVRRSNAIAQHTYKKLGFREMGVRRNFYSLPREDALIMNYFYFNEEKREDTCN